MLTLRPAGERGHADHGWLDSWHSFSFANYDDPAHMGFGALRVLNEDRVAGGGGFPPHAHREMEILSYVVEGQLAHRDSSGGDGVISPGEIQRMTAGTGVTHSEFNFHQSEPVHFLQIWLQPNRAGLKPGYEQAAFARPAEGESRVDLLASPEGGDAVRIHADARVSRAIVADGGTLTVGLRREHAWLQVVRGSATANEQALGQGDGLAVSDEAELVLRSAAGAELLLVELG